VVQKLKGDSLPGFVTYMKFGLSWVVLFCIQ